MNQETTALRTCEAEPVTEQTHPAKNQIQAAISKFFNETTATETSDLLADLLSAYIEKDGVTRESISDNSFAVMKLQQLLFNLEKAY